MTNNYKGFYIKTVPIMLNDRHISYGVGIGYYWTDGGGVLDCLEFALLKAKYPISLALDAADVYENI